MTITGINETMDYPSFASRKTTRTGSGVGFSQQMVQAKTQCSTFTLNVGTAEDGKNLGSIAGGGQSCMSVFKPNDFDPEHPWYKVKIWDSAGNLTERMVDVSQVDVTNSDSADMYAYACYLSESGKSPEAQNIYSRLQGYSNNHAQGADFDRSVFDKVDWLGWAKNLMQMQYDVGNLKGYLDYKQFVDYFQM